MELLSISLNVLTAVGGLSLFAFVLWRIVRWARSRPSGAYVLGALIIPFGGMGNVADPDYKIVHEAQRPRRQEDDDTGDPPEPTRSRP